MILKTITAVLLIGIGSCVNVDAVSDGIVYPDGPAHIVNVVPITVTTTMATIINTITTHMSDTHDVIGVTSVSEGIKVDGYIHKVTTAVTTTIPNIVTNDLDRWDLEQKRKAGVPILEECPMDGSSCHFDEEIWLSHLPTLGELIDTYFEPEDREFFTWLAYCESSGEPQDIHSDAIHPTSKATGWFQHLPKFWIERSFKAGYVGFPIDHPEANVGVAAWLYYEDGGAKHWKACTRKYLREEANG